MDEGSDPGSGEFGTGVAPGQGGTANPGNAAQESGPRKVGLPIESNEGGGEIRSGAPVNAGGPVVPIQTEKAKETDS